MIENIWAVCPLCDSRLQDNLYVTKCLCEAKCPLGHYEYRSQGSYAAVAVIILRGKQECFYFDDMCNDDEQKFEERVAQIRVEDKINWTQYGF